MGEPGRGKGHQERSIKSGGETAKYNVPARHRPDEMNLWKEETGSRYRETICAWWPGQRGENKRLTSAPGVGKDSLLNLGSPCRMLGFSQGKADTA